MNKDLFDELYFGNYRPNDMVMLSDLYEKMVSEIIKLEAHFRKILSKSDLKKFTQLCQCYTTLNDEYARQSYNDGIKFASNFLFNALCDNNSGKK